MDLLASYIADWVLPFGELCVLGQKFLQLPIAKLSNSFNIASKVRSVMQVDSVKVWLIHPIVGMTLEVYSAKVIEVCV